MIRKYLNYFILLTFSVLVIFFNFPNYPKNIAHDETEIVRAALSLVNKPYQVFTPIADGHTTLYLYTLLFSFKVFGFNNFAMRFPVAILSVFNVILFYLILEKFLKDSKKSLIGALLMLTSHWFINFARFSFEIPFLLFFELLSLFLIITYLDLKNKKIANLILFLSSLFSAFAFNSYQPGRIFFIIPIFWFFLNKRFKDILKFLTIFIIFISPLFLYLLTHTQDDIRIKQQLYFADTKLSIVEKLDYFNQNILNNFYLLTIRGDGNGRHNYPNKPAVNPIIAFLFFSGIINSLIQIKRKENLLFLIFLLVAFFPTTLTLPSENPNMLRTYTALPSIFYFVVLGLNWFLNLKGISKSLLLGIATFIIGVSIFKELNTYYVDQSEVFKESFEYSKSIDQIYKFK